MCWHAVRVHHRCRSMGASEAICERVGSLMGRAWSGHTNLNAVMDGVYLDCAKVLCIGGERDAMVVDEVTQCLLAARRKPFLTERFKKARLNQGLAVSHSIHRIRDETQQWLQASGRSSQVDVHATNAHAAPAAWHNFINPEDVQQLRRDRLHAGSVSGLSNARVNDVLQETVTPMKVVAPQPWTLARKGSAASSGKAAASALHEKMKSWFESPDGLEWMRSRAGMYASKGIEEEEEDDDSDAAGATVVNLKTKKGTTTGATVGNVKTKKGATTKRGR